MRYVAPPRGAVEAVAFGRPPLAGWHDHAPWLEGGDWPSIDELNAARSAGMPERFAAQTRALLDDGLHYEQRIAERGLIATREHNWHDLFNALIWLRHPGLKQALNARQVVEIARMGPRQRSRAQCALTHFDEAGALVGVRDPALLEAWDAHDWQGLFRHRREAWLDGSVELVVFGHALLEHALSPEHLLVGKALVFRLHAGADRDALLRACASAIAAGELLRDPQELRPLPLSGVPRWRPEQEDDDFYRRAPCFRPLREGRRYPAASSVG